MPKEFKMNYLKQIYHRYHKSNKKDKTKILNEFCRICSYVRKYAIRILGNPLPDTDKPKLKKKRTRDKTYLKQTISMLQIISEATGYICSLRLHAAIPIWLPHLKNRYHLSQKVENQLRAISSSTIERSLKNTKRILKHKIYGTTKPGSLLKHHIPIKTDNWDVNKPGFIETDLVSHSGNSAEGDFIHSLNTTDIQTTWTEPYAIMGKSQEATLIGLQNIERDLPFTILGIDSDNGSEFINYHLLKYCKDNNIAFTRSRPYKKDDNAHIEQKNWTHVRKILGYVRYDSQEALNAINNLYRNELRLFMNLFLPSQKLIRKTRVGSKYKKIYDKPQTPLQRLNNCKSGNINKTKLKKLNELFETLDPFLLSKVIEDKITKIYRLASKCRNSKPIINQEALKHAA